MRFLKMAILACLGLGIVVVAIANRGAVTVNLLPGDLAALIGLNTSVTLPLFAVIITSVVAGFAIGYIWEWLREYRHRSDAAKTRRAANKLQKEVDLMRKDAGDGDDVLALLEGSGR